MTADQIKSLPTIADLRKIPLDEISAAKATGTYTYDLLNKITDRIDATVARETVTYSRTCGCDGYEVIYGDATRRYFERQRVEDQTGPCNRCK